jgi:hypothetical protein
MIHCLDRHGGAPHRLAMTIFTVMQPECPACVTRVRCPSDLGKPCRLAARSESIRAEQIGGRFSLKECFHSKSGLRPTEQYGNPYLKREGATKRQKRMILCRKRQLGGGGELKKSLDGLHQKQWSTSAGIGGRLAPAWMVDFPG